MNPKLSLRLTASGLLLVNLLLAGGCASRAPSLYQWEGYQPQVYKYFQGESKEAQITELEAGLQKIQASGKAVPPGYHAQLGLLYGQTGNADRMVQEFQTEKTLFPESNSYIDFLLSKNKSAKGGQ
ncbi:MAG: DUF4810 domain-containing protein [Burkholderiaceae bacterium]|nr:DUF4810 domain-containing protein [Burkholderiaceae bacterium]